MLRNFLFLSGFHCECALFSLKLWRTKLIEQIMIAFYWHHALNGLRQRCKYTLVFEWYLYENSRYKNGEYADDFLTVVVSYSVLHKIGQSVLRIVNIFENKELYREAESYLSHHPQASISVHSSRFGTQSKLSSKQPYQREMKASISNWCLRAWVRIPFAAIFADVAPRLI